MGGSGVELESPQFRYRNARTYTKPPFTTSTPIASSTSSSSSDPPHWSLAYSPEREQPPQQQQEEQEEEQEPENSLELPAVALKPATISPPPFGAEDAI